MSLLSEINTDQLPNHIAIIMDGNGRWAKSKGLLRNIGHQNGAKTVAIIHFSNDEEINQESIAKIANQINNATDLKGVELASGASENKHYKWINQGKWNQEKNQFQK